MIDLTSDVCFRLHGKLSANMACAFAIAAALASAMMSRTANADTTLDHVPYGTTQDGQAVDIYTMTNEHGLRVRFLSYGGVITEINTPNRAGRLDNIVLGLGTLREYETLPGHFGAITGRYANRIGGAQFTLNGQTYHLIANNGPNTLHGGPNALDHRVWTVSPLPTPKGVAATLSYASPGGDQNFPGTLTTQVTYTLTNDDVLQIVYVASTARIR
jgi:aldose 1-epimerase